MEELLMKVADSKGLERFKEHRESGVAKIKC